jgi:hypothetical protein
VDAVVYLMLVNDLIHGLYPEAITIGEDVSVSLLSFRYEYIKHICSDHVYSLGYFVLKYKKFL